MELANSFYFPSAKDLSHYPPCFERRSDLSNINYLLVLEVASRYTEDVHVSIGNEYLLYLTVFEELQGSTSIFRITNHFYSTMSFWFVLCSYGFAKN